MCLAGRFSVVTESGSWLDLHHRAWGSVRLFSYLDTAILDLVPIKKGRRLVRRIAKPAEAAMLTSVRPSTHPSSATGISNVRQVCYALMPLQNSLHKDI